MTIKQSTLNTLAVLAFLLIALLLGCSIYLVRQAFQEHNQAVAHQTELKQLGLDLANATHYLTNEARQFVITGQIKHLHNYWNEIDITQTQDKVLIRLKALQAPQAEWDLLNSTKPSFDALTATETRAIHLGIKAHQIPSSALPPAIAAWTLSTKDLKLRAQQQRQIARTILFDTQYNADKQIIMEAIAHFNQRMNAQITHKVQTAQDQIQKATVVLISMVSLLLIGVGLMLWFFQTRLIRPVTQYIKELQENNSSSWDLALIPTGTQELHLFAQTLNQQFQLQQQQNWLQTGQIQLHEQLNSANNIIQIAEKIINFLTSYVEAQVGTFYLFEKPTSSKGCLKMMASYAYSWRKNVANEFKIGEGLVGQAALERKMIVITEPPEDYLYVQSGLGGGTPRCILVIPLVDEDTLKGVIELASFHLLTQAQLEFLTQVMPIIAHAISRVQSHQQIQEQLQHTQVQTEEWHQQQESIQKTNLELQHQIEKLQVQQETLQQTNAKLEERTRVLEHQKEAIRIQNKVLEHTQKMTQTKSAEVELASQSKSEFVANMSHELRTPLNSMLILAKLLAENKTETLDDKQIEYAETIYNAGSDLLVLINEILDLAKIEAGKIELHLEDISVLDLTDHLEQQFRPISQDKKLAFHISIQENLPTILSTDIQRLQQILTNLLANAFKFTQSGTVKFEIQSESPSFTPFAKKAAPELASLLTREMEKITFIAFRVTDTGIGIPKDKQSLIFEPFQQINSATNYNGTGLGLSISHQLAHLLGGELTLVSEVEQGSVFTLYLPNLTPENKLAKTSGLVQSEELLNIEQNVPKVPALTSNVVTPSQLEPDILNPAELEQLLQIAIGETQLSLNDSSESNRSPLESENWPKTTSIVNQSEVKALDPKLLLLNFPNHKREESETIRFAIEPLSSLNEPFPSTDESNHIEPQETTRMPGVPTTTNSPQTISDDRNNLQTEDQFLLIVEDDQNLASLLVELARGQDLKSLIAKDGQTGLQMAAKYQPHTIILDVDLPQLDGRNVMAQLKKNPKTRHIPVYFMSAFEHHCDARKMGAIGYLLKPASMDELTKALQHIKTVIAKKLKTVLVIVDNEEREKLILETVNSGQIQTTTIKKLVPVLQYLQRVSFDCIIIDIEVENGSGIKLIEQLYREEQLAQTPVILYNQRELTPYEGQILRQCEKRITLKMVKKTEHLLDEATLFLHQRQAHLSEDKRLMLQKMHDKASVLKDQKVLIVDDDMRNAFALATVLEDYDMEVLCGRNGQKALALLEEQADIRIVLMDIMMPEMDGYETMRQIRTQKRFQNLPIIAVTAKAMKEDKAKCLEAGANDYLSKPIDTDKLLSLLQVWLHE